MGPFAVLHAITDHVVDSYLSVIQLVEQDVDSMEELVFNPRNTVAVEHIYLLKREIVELRRSVTPLGLPLLQLTQPAGGLVPKEIRRYFRDVRDHHTIVAERISEYDEVLSSLVDAALAKIAVQQNTDMRKISRVGRDRRRAGRRCRYLWDELREHAGTRLQVRLPVHPVPHRLGVCRLVLSLPPQQLAVNHSR